MKNEVKQFKVMFLHGREYPEHQTAFVRWNWIEPHEAQALKNHGQDLEKLHSRGGLSPLEIYAVVSGKSFREAFNLKSESECIQWLKELFPQAPRAE